jgi:glycosyltransferase involved in cell wall biosynthesis
VNYSLSVVICSHNPRSEYILRVLGALERQTLPKERWELLVVDNASKPELASSLSLDWHPHGRIVREMTLGLTPARLRGSAEARSDVIVYVDDDNVLADDYLAHAETIATIYPFIGVWGGSCIPEFETPPEPWTQAYWPILALRDVDIVRWSNTLDDWQTHPCGAGMCVRRAVLECYARRLKGDAVLSSLDRKGTSLMSAGDTDLVYTARAANLGFGTFPQLRLTHLISSRRTTQDYLLKLVEGIAASNVLLAQRHGKAVEQTDAVKSFLRGVGVLVTKGSREAAFYNARKRGARIGKQMFAALDGGPPR